MIVYCFPHCTCVLLAVNHVPFSNVMVGTYSCITCTYTRSASCWNEGSLNCVISVFMCGCIYYSTSVVICSKGRLDSECDNQDVPPRSR